MIRPVRPPSVELRGTLYATGFVFLAGSIALAVRKFDPLVGGELPRWLVPVGTLLGLAGAVLGLACVRLFLSAGRGTPAPFDPPREFVALGPYAYLRNPMHVGGLGLFLGSGLVLRSPAILLLGLLVFAAAHLFIVLVEEPGLESRFGESYREYKRRVRRWVPRIRRN